MLDQVPPMFTGGQSSPSLGPHGAAAPPRAPVNQVPLASVDYMKDVRNLSRARSYDIVIS